jgi:hypothetical protein
MRLQLRYVIKQLRHKHFSIEEKKKTRRGNPHIFFYLINERGEVCTNVKSHFSCHPDQDYIENGILRLMAEQLHLEKQKDWEEYIKCDKSYQWLLDHLHKNNIKTTD